MSVTCRYKKNTVHRNLNFNSSYIIYSYCCLDQKNNYWSNPQLQDMGVKQTPKIICLVQALLLNVVYNHLSALSFEFSSPLLHYSMYHYHAHTLGMDRYTNLDMHNTLRNFLIWLIKLKLFNCKCFYPQNAFSCFEIEMIVRIFLHAS